MVTAIMFAVLLSFGVFGHGKPLPCNEACTPAQLAAESRLVVTVDQAEARDGAVTVAK